MSRRIEQDPERDWTDFWADTLSHQINERALAPDDEWSAGRVISAMALVPYPLRAALLAELSDYRAVIENVSEVYVHITGGRMSKPNYLAEDVIAEADANYRALHEGDE